MGQTAIMTDPISFDELMDSLTSLRTAVQAASKEPEVRPPTIKTVGGRTAVDEIMWILEEYAGFRGTTHLQRKLERVLRNSSEDELWEWVKNVKAKRNNPDLAALVEDLTNHETYFFRDCSQLDVLSESILPQIIASKIKQGTRSIRLWSAACATGEEAYTLAILLLQAFRQFKSESLTEAASGVFIPQGWSLSVVGADISRQAVRVAKDGIYQTGGLGSFRQFPEQYRHYFETVIGNADRRGALEFLRVKPPVKSIVTFEQNNLMTPNTFMTAADLVLCRNMLIYIEENHQKVVQRNLTAALLKGGYLLMSPVDKMRLADQYKEHWFNRCVIYEKK